MISTSYAATEEMTNINRVSRLLMDPCTDQLRDLLRFYIPPANFNTIIQTVKSRLPRMTEPQRKLILPNSGLYSGIYDDMDISLLYILLRNVCGIQAHNKGWGNTPDSADRSVSANIERLRLARNCCGHSTGGMSNAEFNQVWSEIRAAVVDLDKTLGIGNKYQEAVDFIRNDTTDPTRDRHFRDQLLEQIKETENNKNNVHSLQKKTEENNEQFIEVKQRMIKLESMRNVILWFLKILYFVKVLFVFPGIGSQQKINERNIPLNIQASHLGHKDIVDLLIKSGADCNKIGKDGTTLLWEASGAGHVDIVDLLIKSGADCNKSAEFDTTPLCKASYAGHVGIVDLLIKSGADCNKRDNFGRTPLSRASYAGHADIVDLLIKGGADQYK